MIRSQKTLSRRKNLYLTITVAIVGLVLIMLGRAIDSPWLSIGIFIVAFVGLIIAMRKRDRGDFDQRQSR